MEQTQAQRRLVKSPPELWAELSDEEALARHLAEFGEIRITRTDPESTVAWEGCRASGTVQIEEAGWGTKVILTAWSRPLGDSIGSSPEANSREPKVIVQPAPEPVAVVEPEPVAVAEQERRPAEPAPAKLGFFARLFGRRPTVAPEREPMRITAPRPVAKIEPVPEPKPEPAPEPEPEPLPPAAQTEPQDDAEPEIAEAPAIVVPADEPTAVIDAARIEEVLTEVLDNLGAAHHRPFSRD